MPPYSFTALLRAEANDLAQTDAFLDGAVELADRLLACHRIQGVELLGPVPSPMERRAGRYRAQLLILATQRSALHQLLHLLLVELEQQPQARRVRWSIDVDPMDMF